MQLVMSEVSKCCYNASGFRGIKLWKYCGAKILRTAAYGAVHWVMYSGGTQLYRVYTRVMIMDCECSLVGTIYCVCPCVWVFLCALNKWCLVSPMVLKKQTSRQERIGKIIFRSIRSFKDTASHVAQTSTIVCVFAHCLTLPSEIADVVVVG